MRIYETISYNLKDIRFKDNQRFIEELLQKQGCSYSDVAFSFRSDYGEQCDKVLKKFPGMKCYKQEYASSNYGKLEYTLTSVRREEDGTINWHIDDSQKADFANLLQKIPRPINFPFMGVVLDYVNWYGDEPQMPICSFRHESPEMWCDPNHHFYGYFSNSIRFIKEFDSGNKYNIVRFCIDRTGPDGSLRPYPETFQNAIAGLGKPFDRTLECVFDPQEKDTWELASAKFNKISFKSIYDNVTFENQEDSLSNDQRIDRFMTPVSGFSPKSVFGKIARKNGYRYRSFDNGFYEYRLINEYGHMFIVQLSVIPFSSVLDATISVEGYNFSHTLGCAPRVVVYDEAGVQQYAESVFQLAVRAADLCAETLFDLYGKTPQWFVE